MNDIPWSEMSEPPNWDDIPESAKNILNQVDWGGELTIMAHEIDNMMEAGPDRLAEYFTLQIMIGMWKALVSVIDSSQPERILAANYFAYQIDRIAALGDSGRPGDNGDSPQET